MKINAIIIDDESAGRDFLNSLIDEYIPNVKVIGTAESALEGLKLLKSENLDLIFLDVEMPNGSGFDFIDAIERNKYKIVLTTAYQDFALKAFKYRVDGYLLKPIDLDDLEVLIRDLFPSEEKNNTSPNRVIFRTQESIEYVDVPIIIRVETEGNYAKIYCSDGRKLLITKNMKQIEEILYFPNFVKTHKSHLVNSNYIKRFVKIDGGYFEMLDGSTVPLSRRNKDEILKKLEIGKSLN